MLASAIQQSESAKCRHVSGLLQWFSGWEFARKAMTNLDSILKIGHQFASKGPYYQSYGFSSSHVQI